MTARAPVQDDIEAERKRVAEVFATKAYVDNPELLSWYTAELEPSTEARAIMENYSNVPAAEVVSHIKKTRDEAFKTFPYPCLGNWGFLNFNIGNAPAYPEILERIKDGDHFLDIGCCVGSDIRRLVYDGAPSENLHGSDLKKEFWDLGYELFQDQSTLKTNFIAADIFDAQSELNQLEGKISIINAASFFHLFDLEGQVKAAKTLVQLLKPEPGGLIFGRQCGLEKAGKFAAVLKGLNPYWHSPESWAKMWEEVGKETGTKWKVESSLGDESLSLRTKTNLMPDASRFLTFTIRKM